MRNPIKRLAIKTGAWLVKSASGVTFDPMNVEWYARNGYSQIASILGAGGPSWSGESVSTEKALNHSVVWACYRIISESIGFIPAVVMQEAEDGTVVPARKHPMYRAMDLAPNDEMTAQTMAETMTGHCVLSGNGYSKIERRSGTGTAVKLWMLEPGQVKTERDLAGRLNYIVSVKHESDKTYTVIPGRPHDILHLRGLGWDGLTGYSVIHMARQSIGAAIAAERNVGTFWKNGGRKPYTLKLNQKLKDEEQFKKFREDWESTYSQPNRVPILEPWLDMTELGMSMRDAQMLESRQFSIPEICRWFSISPHLVGDLSRATFSNIEHLFLQFLQMTLQTWLVRWESEFWRCILTDDEKSQGYILRHNVDELLRGDFKTRMEGYSQALQNGHMSIDEVRHREGQNKLPDGAGSHYHIQLNMQEVGKIGEAPIEAQPTKSGIRRVK
jgi:HK97 family phage portal protein